MNSHDQDDEPDLSPEEVASQEVDPAEVDFEDDEEGFSLEELSAAYAGVAAGTGEFQSTSESADVLTRDDLAALSPEPVPSSDEEEIDSDEHAEAEWLDDPEEVEVPPTPEVIVEAALFVGHPDNTPLTSTRLASIMRDVSPEEVEAIIERLNASYREERQGIRIAQDEMGYRMIVAPEVESVRLSFSGKIRETRLNQSAIEVLSLVAYQPGITVSEVTDRRGRESASLLNQMVRRRLVEMRREELPPDDKTKKAKKPKLVSRYYPAERLLVLLGLESLDDLPHVEEANL